MLRNRTFLSHVASFGAAWAAIATLPVAGCSSDDTGGAADAGPDGTSVGIGAESGAEAASEAAPLDAGASEAGTFTASACVSQGKPTLGPSDDHCALPDGGGFVVQATSVASCMPDVGAPNDDGGGCAYGDTLFGNESDDDDCKYHVKWSATPICEGAPGVVFTAVVTLKTADGSAGAPLTGANTLIEAFTTSPGDWDAADFCDTMSTHPSPSAGKTVEGPPGTYTGQIVFDQSGQWTVRFHFHQECLDVLPDSPHGHAAYHITVP